MNGDFRVGPWFVEPGLNTISRNGTTVQLEPKVMSVLVCLAEHPGEPVSKEQLLQTVWPNTFVSDGVLTRSISELRRVFEDEAKQPRVIQTIAKRGYRLVAPVTPVNGVPLQTSPPVPDFPREGQPRIKLRAMRRFGIAGSAVLLIALLISLSVGKLRGRFGFTSSTPQIHSLAVLPFKNLSGDSNQDYFAEGITDLLITYLSKISSLRVISHTSTGQYKNTKKTVPEIARELGVDGVVEGSVQRVGDRARVNVQLVYAPQETHLWAESYEREVRDMLDLQGTVAHTIADHIRAETTAGERERLQEPHPVNQAALDAYLKGAYYEHKIGEGASFGERDKAVEAYLEAIHQDPTFARAYVGLATAHIRGVSPAPADIPTVRDSLEKALALDPNLAEAHLWTARFKQFHDWDFPAAEKEFRHAIELDPNNAGAHDFYGFFLDTQGRFDEADREERRAQELDPDNEHVVDGYNIRGQYDRVLEVCQREVDRHPNAGIYHHCLYQAYLRNGRYDEVVPELQKTVTYFGHPELANPLARAYARGGIRAMLRLWARDLENLQSSGVAPVLVAQVYAELADADNAFKWLEKGYEQRDGFLVDLNVNPLWKPLHSDPRFQDLVRRVGLSKVNPKPSRKHW